MHQPFIVQGKANLSVIVPGKKQQLQNLIQQVFAGGLKDREILERLMNGLVKIFPKSRCIFYTCHAEAIAATINHESVSVGVPEIRHQTWLLQDNLLFQTAINHKCAIALIDVLATLDLDDNPQLQAQII